jgi:phage shock protein B
MSNTVIVLFFTVGLPIICGTFLIMAAMASKRKNNERAAQDEEDTRTIQELHQACEKLSRRIEALETIILGEEAKHRREGFDSEQRAGKAETPGSRG